MKDPHRTQQPRFRVKASSKHTLLFMIALVVVVICSLFLFMRYKDRESVHALGKNHKLTSTDQSQGLSKNPAEESNTLKLRQTSATSSPLQNRSTSDTLDNSTQSVLQSQINDSKNNLSDRKKDETPLSTATSGQQLKGDPYQKLADDLNAFYTHLDQQPYMQDFHLKDPSKKHFSKLLQILVDNPPAITRETDDYFTLLKNTAHFFRVLGKENISILKGILDREKNSFESILKTFYTLTEHPEYLKREFSLAIPKDNLYDYAGFFLNTIGGRLYLFRRDSVSRMTISYYAVLIIDKANRQGNSRLGIDLRPSIDSLIEEIENAGNNLKLKEEYLDTLYDLKENYDN